MAVVREIVRWQGRRREEEKEQQLAQSKLAATFQACSPLHQCPEVISENLVAKTTNNTDTLGAKVVLVFLVLFVLDAR